MPEPTPAPAPSGSRLSPRNWRVPTRLNAILLIPVLVGLVMGGFQVKNSIDTWQEARDAEKVAKIVAAASDYAEAMLNERDISAEPLLNGDKDNADVKNARAYTDEMKDVFHQAVVGMPDKPGLKRRLALVEEAEPTLEKVRATAFTPETDPVKTEEGYVQVEHLLMEFTNELGLGTGNITAYGRTVYALALAKGGESLMRSIGTHLLVKPSTNEQTRKLQITAFTSYAYLENVAIQEYISGGTERDAARLTEAMQKAQTEGQKKLAEAKQKIEARGGTFKTPPQMNDMIKLIGSGATPDELKQRGVTPETWMAAATSKFEAYSQVEKGLIDTAVSEAGNIASDAQRDAYINGAVTLVALLTAFIIAGVMARQMSRSMRQLRTAAFGIAEQRLPMLVDQLSRTDPGRVDTRVQPIPINTRDEIGEVARAFDQVHREAVRLAAEQALLRGNINAIFTNLSRRNQSLIEGQLTLITDLENNEADPDQLENLFRLDHLATRMRRNGENLLVLAGEEPGRRWDQPVPLVDVLRAASSEVEQYERIELSGVPEADIHGRAVTDLVHLLAELLENATTFSSPQTKVRVTATRLPDGRVMIEIHDKGIGLTAEDFADINHKLANPPTVDAAISQRMGLFVVGRLSDRHGIRVQLRPSGEQAGTTSLVMLPDAITHGGGGDQAQRDEFTVSQIIPEQQPFQGENFGGPMRTAAELGFDDSRYADVPDDIRELDPIGRSLMREERRAALESQSPGHPELTEAEDFLEESAPRQPAYDERQSSYDERQPAYDERQPAYDERQSSYDERQPAYDERQPAYDERRPAYDDQQSPYGESQAPYEQPQASFAPQTTYEEPQQTAYDDSYYSPNGGGYPEPSYAEAEQTSVAGPSPESLAAFEDQPYQDDWPQQTDYQSGYRSEYAPETESEQATDVTEPDRVGFERPGAAPSGGHALTSAGLPRRGTTANGNGQVTGGTKQQEQAVREAPKAATPSTNGFGASTGLGGDWRSTNDERWQQASQLRKPKAGGVTSSGLPRRVPKANLVQGAAETTPQGGPQVSRAPEDVRGRLSNLRRGVQRGRNAGSETNGQGFGPDSTYNQER